jgi:rRNA maturation protein Nop10
MGAAALFCYYGAMRSKIRSVVACLLLVLLPLQAIASVAGLRAMPDCPMMTMQQDDCAEYGEPTPQMHQADDQPRHGEHAQDSNPCGIGAGCPAMGGVAVLPAAHQFSVASGAIKLSTTVTSHYISFVPAGLQRPPRLPA